jgi:hypothetical protein
MIPCTANFVVDWQRVFGKSKPPFPSLLLIPGFLTPPSSVIVLHSFWVQKSKDIALAALDEHPSLKEWIYLTAGLSKRLMETIARDVPDPNALPPSIVSAIFHAAMGLSLLSNLSPGTDFDPAARPALLELLKYLSQRWRLASELDSRLPNPA